MNLPIFEPLFGGRVKGQWVLCGGINLGRAVLTFRERSFRSMWKEDLASTIHSF